MSIGIGKTNNAYAKTINDIGASKAVFMAIAISFALRMRDGNIDAARQMVMDEWDALYQNGIVPQKPSRS